MSDSADAIGLPTYQCEVQFAAHCYGGAARMTPTEYPEYTGADEVWVRGDLVLARIAELDARVIAAESAIEAHNRAMVDACETQRTTGRCDPYRDRGRMCSDCPRNWTIDDPVTGEPLFVAWPQASAPGDATKVLREEA